MKPESYLGLVMLLGAGYCVYLFRYYKKENYHPITDKLVTKSTVTGVRG